MEDIYSLIQCLSSREWESFQSFLTCFSTRGKDPEGIKQLQLAKILRDCDKCPESNRCSLLVYGVKRNRNFDKLRSRLKEKVLDFLLTDISTDKKLDLDELDLAYIKIKKMSAQYQQIIYSKSNNDVAIGLLDEIIKLCIEYEYYLAAADHLKIKRGLIGWKLGADEIDRLSSQIELLMQQAKDYMNTEYFYHKLMALYEFNGTVNKENIKSFLKCAIEETKQYLKFRDSKIIRYYLKLFEMDLENIQEKYFEARRVCLELLPLVRSNKAVYRRQRIGVIYDNLANCEYFLGNYSESMEWAREAQNIFKTGSENHYIAMEQEFYAIFAMGDYLAAMQLSKKLIADSVQGQLGEFISAKYHFLYANALFKNEKFSDALQVLSKRLEISRDKPGWEVGIRVLKIMALIELQKLDDASKAVQSLRQFIKYTQKKFPVGPREKTILNLLMVAERNGFQFNTLKGQANKYFDLLSQKGGTNSWEPFTHEVIPFHTWFGQKLKKKHKEPAAKRPGRKEAVAL